MGRASFNELCPFALYTVLNSLNYFDAQVWSYIKGIRQVGQLGDEGGQPILV
jgi:hypothetical protein